MPIDTQTHTKTMSNIAQEISIKDGIYRSQRLPISLPNHPKTSIIPFLFKATNPNSPALIDAETSQTLTFSGLEARVSRLASALLDLDVSKKDVVLIFSPNSIYFPVAFLAAAAVGAVVTTANPQYTVAELSKQIKDSNPKLIITVGQLYDKIESFDLPCIMLDDHIPRTSDNPKRRIIHGYSRLIESAPERPLPDVLQSDAAAIFYSSGTTGASKGAVLTHGNLMASALMMTSDQEAGQRSVFLCFLPMFHIFGLSALVYAQLQRGNTVVAMPRYEMKAMLRAIGRYGVTHLFVVPPVVIELVKNREAVKEYHVSTLKEVLSGAAPLGKDMVEACSELFPGAVLCQAYGMTEAAGVVSFESRRMPSPHSGSAGALAAGVEAQIVDLVTKRRRPAPFETGEIWIRGPFVMKGYLNNEKASMESIDDEKWLHTGDVGYFDNEGRLYVVDRVKELIKYKAYQVAPAEIEELLLTHPEIVDAAVIGLPDAEAGEIPVAYVVRSSKSSLTTQQVQRFIAKQVAPFKKLRKVVFTEAIPRSTTGKILRKELRQKIKSHTQSSLVGEVSMKITLKGSAMVRPATKVRNGSLWLSSLDLVFPDNYHTRLVSFYRSNEGAADFFDTSVLKAALGRALVEFYPYAGRLRRDNSGRIEINCNGEGVLFLEAECDGAVDDLGFNPRPDLSLVPTIDYSNGISSFPLFLIQVTRFKCGGVSIGFANEHHVSDGVSYLHFINTWSEIARGLTPAVPQSLDRRRFLSPRNPPRPQFPHIEHHPPPSLKAPLRNPADKSFSTFRLTPGQIGALKQRCGNCYTTYEVIAGHAWRCASIARGLPGDQETKLQLPVDARRRRGLEPPLPPGFFGNGVFHTAALATCGELGSRPLRFAVEKVREAIGRMEGEYLRSAVDYVELHLGSSGVVRGDANVNSPNLAITSWVGLPFYEPDFGWGKPVYCGPGAVMSEGVCFLTVDPRNQGTLLVAITLHKEHMLPFQKLLYDDNDEEVFVMSRI